MDGSTEFTDEELMAHADGELAPQRRAQLIQRLADDPVLRRRLARFTQTRAALRSAFAGGAATPVPSRLLALFDEPRRRERRWTSGRRTVLAGLALAASIVIAITIGALPRVHTPHDEIAAAAGLDPALLAEVLENQPSGVPVPGGDAAHRQEIMALATARTAGGYCRQFEASDESGGAPRRLRGVACREDDGSWPLRTLVDLDAIDATASPDGYVTASGSDDPLAGLPPEAQFLTPQAEAAALSTGWK